MIYLFVLVSRDGDELRFGENECFEVGVRYFGEVARFHEMEPRLVLVHGVQDGLL